MSIFSRLPSGQTAQMVIVPITFLLLSAGGYPARPAMQALVLWSYYNVHIIINQYQFYMIFLFIIKNY